MKATLFALVGSAAIISAQSVVTDIPAPAGTSLSPEPITITGSFDGEGYLYDRDSEDVCQGQTETGVDDTIFILEDGASISNVIIGPNQAEGIHCLGSCTITNVWFQKVCEDAITISGDGEALITGGGAFSAEDKIIQINGIATVTIENWYAEDFGKVARSCGNCDGNGGPRHIIFNNVVAVDGGVLCGINTNYGDTCTVTNSCHNDGKSCDMYEGNDDGSEPDKIGSGPDGESCFVEGLTEDC